MCSTDTRPWYCKGNGQNHDNHWWHLIFLDFEPVLKDWEHSFIKSSQQINLETLNWYLRVCFWFNHLCFHLSQSGYKFSSIFKLYPRPHPHPFPLFFTCSAITSPNLSLVHEPTIPVAVRGVQGSHTCSSLKTTIHLCECAPPQENKARYSLANSHNCYNNVSKKNPLLTSLKYLPFLFPHCRSGMWLLSNCLCDLFMTHGNQHTHCMPGIVTESSQTVVNRIGRIIFIPHKYSYCIIFPAKNSTYLLKVSMILSPWKC